MSSDFTLEPPDPHGAAGPNGILQVINLRLTYWTRTGTAIWGPTPFGTFFPWANGKFLSDPRALYDPQTGRFYVEILQIDFNGHHSYINVAVSKSSNPASPSTNDWCVYQIENTRVVGGTPQWGDYSAFGYDSQALYVSLNMYAFDFTGGDAQITVLAKSAFLNGTTNYAFVYTTGGSEGGFTLQPCTVIGTNTPGNVAYFGETLPGANSSTNVRLWALSDPLGTRALSSSLIAVPDNGGPPPSSGAPQPGTSTTIDPSDGRAQGNAFWNNGAVWFCTTVGGGSERSTVYYYAVNTGGFPSGTPGLAESGSIDGGPGVWTYQPSIGGNGNGDVCIVYCQSSTSSPPTILYAVQPAGVPSFQTPAVLKASPGYYNGTRWGDYGSVSVDPADGSFWITHEWAASTSRLAWSTWWGHVLVGLPPAIAQQPASQTVLVGGPATFSVTANGTAPLRYQWRLNGTNVPAATNATLTVAQSATLISGAYSVFITNTFGFVTSAEALLSPVPVLAWGDNEFNQGSVLFAALTNAVAISAGGYHSLTLRADGSVTAWGANESGQVTVPPNLTNATAIAAGGYHSLAARGDGTVVAWGANQSGQTNVPASATSVVAVSAGQWHSLALRADGTVVAWGDSSSGQTQVPASLTNVVAIVAGAAHSLALKGNGTVIAWGSNLGADGSYAGQSQVPANLNQVVAIAAGDFHSLALRADGAVIAWGDNSQGQCGVPASLTNAVAIAAGGLHSLSIIPGGRVIAWGDDLYGQSDPSTNLVGVIAVSAGSYHSLALVGQPPPGPQLRNPALRGRVFSVSLSTLRGRAYFLQSRSSLNDNSCSLIAGIVGNGSLRTLSDPAANAPRLFYRIRQQ